MTPWKYTRVSAVFLLQPLGQELLPCFGGLKILKVTTMIDLIEYISGALVF